MMGLRLLVAAVFCLSTWMTTVDANPTRAISCCIMTSTTKVPLKRIVNYTLQSEGKCPIAAIIFQTNKGKRICSDPADSWAIRAKQKVDQERGDVALLEKTQTEEGSTIDITPAASTASKKNPWRRNRNGRKRHGRKGRGKKGQKELA